MSRFKAATLLALAGLVTLAGGAGSGRLEPLRFDGKIDYSEDISAIAVVGERLLIASDETAGLQWLVPSEEPLVWTAGERSKPLVQAREADFEGLAVQGNTVFAICSHSWRRKRMRRDHAVSENRKRVATTELPPARDHLFRLRVNSRGDGFEGPAESMSLRPILGRDPILAPFSRVPGKENGVDIEAIGVHGKQLYVGFRSPILRSGHVPVLVVEFGRTDLYELRLVDLDGRGIRELTRVPEGWLVLAGDENGFALYLWDGADQVPGRDRPPSPVRHLGDMPTVENGTPEGFAVLDEDASSWEILVVYDGVVNGAPARVRVPKPRR